MFHFKEGHDPTLPFRARRGTLFEPEHRVGITATPRCKIPLGGFNQHWTLSVVGPDPRGPCSGHEAEKPAAVHALAADCSNRSEIATKADGPTEMKTPAVRHALSSCSHGRRNFFPRRVAWHQSLHWRTGLQNWPTYVCKWRSRAWFRTFFFFLFFFFLQPSRTHGPLDATCSSPLKRDDSHIRAAPASPDNSSRLTRSEPANDRTAPLTHRLGRRQDDPFHRSLLTTKP